MTTYDDYEPEDAWDATDAVADQVHNLIERVVALDGLPEPDAQSLDTLLDVIHERVEVERRRRTLSGREFLRAVQLIEDLRHVRGRL